MDHIDHDDRPSRIDEMNGESWPEHEHLSAELEPDALRLLAEERTPESAKIAVDSVEQLHSDQARGEFAQSLGFESYGQRLAASAALNTNAAKLWLVTLLCDGHSGLIGNLWSFGRMYVIQRARLRLSSWSDRCRQSRSSERDYVSAERANRLS